MRNQQALCLETLGQSTSGGGAATTNQHKGFHDGDDEDNYSTLDEAAAADDELGPVFRVVALWFEPGNASNPQVNAEMTALVSGVPTYKFVPLIYQVNPRVSLY